MLSDQFPLKAQGVRRRAYQDHILTRGYVGDIIDGKNKFACNDILHLKLHGTNEGGIGFVPSQITTKRKPTK